MLIYIGIFPTTADSFDVDEAAQSFKILKLMITRVYVILYIRITRETEPIPFVNTLAEIVADFESQYGQFHGQVTVGVSLGPR